MKSYWNDVGSTIVEITEVLQTAEESIRYHDLR